MSELDRYPWSGHSAVMGNNENDWMDISYVRTQFGGSRRKKVCELRVQIAKRGLDELGLSLAEITRHVGVSTSGIARAVKRLVEGAEE